MRGAAPKRNPTPRRQQTQVCSEEEDTVIGRISQARFEKRCQSQIPSPEISPRHWFENSSDRTLGLVVFYPPQLWGAAVFKKRRGHYQVWRQATTLSSEREAVDTLLQLFGLTNRGYREALAEREFFTEPRGRMEFLLNSSWKFDPGYTAEIKTELDAPVTAITQKCFTEIYPWLQAQLRSEPGQKSASSLQGFTTPCTAMGARVVGLFCLVVTLDGPDEIRIVVGREAFIEAERERIVRYWNELGKKPGVNVHWHHTATADGQPRKRAR